MKRTYKWQFHFNAVHNMTPEKEENKHTHSFLVILWMEVTDMDMEQQNLCEKELKHYLGQYNGKYLNELDKFQGKIPTIETICETLYYDTEKIAAAYGMEQIQMEVGDSPVALFVMGKKLLLGGTGQIVSDELFEEYRQQLDQ
ncbi:MAG: 6-carboxytetrahydropterin synthase [Lachnospiraceae bacterium]|nr:6-carboxytetrahydropterin synthase [Lachnospiraceae bacterium]MBQ7780631.1 6-carboxytetrahydropterin synthase [Lachnospiraceae bacterium]